MLLLNVDMRFQGAMHEREPYEEANLNLISTLSVKQSQFRYQRRPAKDDFIPTSSMICLDLGHLTFKGGKINILNLEENYSIYVPIKIQLRKIQFLF
ncbi:unnamed protein product [Rotaria sordida]|uniref:Uncharacterized protein n=1 Tax=Rotaria sordida TaxID=392033 RepID=A0A819D5J8_9BILA|nr:unnamed protein product [Rotaria sordida]